MQSLVRNDLEQAHTYMFLKEAQQGRKLSIIPPLLWARPIATNINNHVNNQQSVRKAKMDVSKLQVPQQAYTIRANRQSNQEETRQKQFQTPKSQVIHQAINTNRPTLQELQKSREHPLTQRSKINTRCSSIINLPYPKGISKSIKPVDYHKGIFNQNKLA